MSLWSRYFTDTVTVHKFSGTNEYGDAVFAPHLNADGISIKCRMEHKLQEVLDKNGNKVTSEATLYTDDFIPPLSIVFDTFNKRFTVRDCKVIKNLAGQLDHYEVIL